VVGPSDGLGGDEVQEVLERWPELSAHEQVLVWLAGVRQRWIGHVSTVRH